MSRYNKMMTEVLDAIFEGYTLDSKSGKLVVTNEAASKKAQDSLHSLVLEKARELWDQLEAAEESLSSVAEEIRFEEMNTDPSSMSGAISQTAAPEDDMAGAGAAAPDAGLEPAPALESAGSISELLSTDDLNLDDIFENMDQLDNHQNTPVPAGPDMPFDEMAGGMSAGNIGGGMGMEAEGDIEDGDEEYDALSMGMGDDGDMGDPADAMADDGMGDMEDEELASDDMGDPEMGGDMGMDMEGEDDMGGFDFDLDLDDPEMGGDLAMGGEDDMMGDPEMGGDMGDEIGLGDEEEAEEGMGRQSYRMEAKGDKPAFLKKDDDDKDDDKKDDDKDDDDSDDDDDDDDDKPAFLKKKKDD